MKYLITLSSSLAIVFVILQFAFRKGNDIQHMNGLSLVAPPSPVEEDCMKAVVETGSSWVGVIPYAFSRKGKPNVYFDTERQRWWGESSKGTIAQIQFAKKCSLKVMLKPHVWISGDGWPGEYELATEEEWAVWENDYQNYILNHAEIADSLDVDLFSIGCEYRKAVVARPKFWENLISEVRKVYKGEITYAANWDNYQNVVFWDKLDYIGVDGYFPLSELQHPNIDELKEGWKIPKEQLLQIAQKYDKQILFTEIGYESTDYNTVGHWLDDQPKAPNQESQAVAYEAFFETWLPEETYAGAFFWKWFLTERKGRNYETAFTPQGKKAEKVLKKYFDGQ